MTTGADATFFGRLALFAEDIKVSHSVFALPFALLSATLAVARPGAVWGETWGVWTFVLVILAMVTARTAAMSANRLLDAEIDKANPRTARRALPAGRLGRGYVAGAWAAASGGFGLACVGFWLIYGNVWPTLLAVPVLAFICAYPLLKRFSAWCHVYLGLALGLAPLCAWIAVRGDVSAEPLLMLGAVALWTAGFDVIYATTDYDHDRSHGVHSMPAALGLVRALVVSRLMHVAAVGLLAALGWVAPELGWIWASAVVTVTGILMIEHSLVRPDDLSKVNLAFFTLNGLVSLVLGVAGVTDVLVTARGG